MRVVGIVAPFAPRGSVLGENSFYRATGGKWHRRPVPDAPSRGTPLKSLSQAKFRDRAVWGLQKGPVITGPATTVFGENEFYRVTLGTRPVGSPCG